VDVLLKYQENIARIVLESEDLSNALLTATGRSRGYTGLPAANP